MFIISDLADIIRIHEEATVIDQFDLERVAKNILTEILERQSKTIEWYGNERSLTKEEYNLCVSSRANKIPVIKMIRQRTGCDLLEAKRMVEANYDWDSF